MNAWVVVTIVLVVVYAVFSEVSRRYYEAQYQGFFETGHYDLALKALDKLPARMFISTRRQYELRFQAYVAQDDKEMATRMIELMVRMRGSAKRVAATAATGFNYFAQIGDKKRAKELLADLKALKGADQDLVADCQLTYDIVFSKSYAYIDQMEQLLPMNANNPALQGKLCFLLWKQYANKGDKTHAKAYRRRFEELTNSDTPQGEQK